MLVIGSEGFERFIPHLKRLGLRTVLISTFRNPTNMDLTDAGYHLPGPADSSEVVEVTLRERATWAMSVTVPDEINLRDAEVKEILEVHDGSFKFRCKSL